MDRLFVLAPALLLIGTLAVALVVFAVRSATGRAPRVEGVKHNQLFGPFLGRFVAWFLGPVERLLLGRVSPNAITAMSLGLCAITGAAVALGHLAGAVWLYVLAGGLDVLDGRIARLSGQQTKSGALFDSVSDRWGELFALGGYAWFLHDSAWLLAVILALGSSMMVSYTRARAESLGITLAGGVMQRAERMILTSLGTLVAAAYGDADAAVPIVGATLLLVGVASSATAIGRWVAAYRALAKPAPAYTKVQTTAITGA